MEKVFVDPVLHSRRVARLNQAVFAGLLLALAAVVWLRWYAADRSREGLRFALMMSAVIAAGWGGGYYIIARNRRLLMNGARLRVSEEGLCWETPGGRMEVKWSEVQEIQMESRPSRTRRPDIWIRTERGRLGVFMRWAEAAQSLPEPLILSGGRRFRRPGGEIFTLLPDTSELAAVLAAHVPAEKIKRGVATSL